MGDIIFGPAESDHFAARAKPVLKDQTRHHNMAATDAQIGLAGQNNPARFLSTKSNRLAPRPFARDDKIEIAPFAIGEDNRITG